MQDKRDLKEENRQLKEQRKYLDLRKQENEELIEKVKDIDVDAVFEQNEELLEENRKLKEEVQKVLTVIPLMEDEDRKRRSENLGEITLVFCDVETGIEKNFKVNPKMFMGNAFDLFCEQNGLKRLQYFFYTKKTAEGKVSYVDEGKTGIENGLAGGKQIFFEHVGRNTLWQKRVESSDDDE